LIVGGRMDGWIPRAYFIGPLAIVCIPRQMNMTFDTVELQGMSAAQRKGVTHLASLLMQAAGVATAKEHDDDER
jgi:hypothetical protein